MTEEEKDIELLENFLDNTIGAEERLAIEGRLQIDSDFRQLLNDLKILRESIRQNSRLEIKQELIELEKKISPTAKGKTVSFLPWLIGVAASIAIVATTFLLWPRPTDTQKLFAQYFEPYPNVIMPTVRGEQDSDTTLMAKAYRAYDSGNYQSAVSLFEQIKSKDEGVYLYLGNSYLANNNPEKAIVCFEKVITDYDVFDEQAEWYLALSYLYLQDERVRKNLKKISAQSEAFGNRANQILEKLK